MITAGEMWLETQIPFLALPVIKQLDEATINAITDALFEQIILFIDLATLKLTKNVLQNKWALATGELSSIAKQKGVESDDYKKALKIAADDFAKLVHTGPI